MTGHPPRIPVWLADEQSIIYSVTICVADRKPVLANDSAFNAFKVAAKLEQWKVLAAVLMPDHLHVIIAPTEDREARVGDFSAAVKRWMREEIQKDGKRLIGNGSRDVLIDCYDQMNRFRINGYSLRKMQCVLDW